MTSILNLIRLTEQVSSEMTVQWTKAMPYDLGVSEALVLAALRNGPEKSSVLAAQYGYTKAAITHIASKLVTLGAIERISSLEDKRIVKLALTDHGRHILEEAQQIGVALREQLFEGLTEQERLAYETIQRKMLTQLQQMNA